MKFDDHLGFILEKNEKMIDNLPKDIIVGCLFPLCPKLRGINKKFYKWYNEIINRNSKILARFNRVKNIYKERLLFDRMFIYNDYVYIVIKLYSGDLFKPEIFIRYTNDGWKTYRNCFKNNITHCKYIYKNFAIYTLCAKIKLSDIKWFAIGTKNWLWDNNHGWNYSVDNMYNHIPICNNLKPLYSVNAWIFTK